MGAEDYGVEAAELAAHAKRVHDIAERVNTARQAVDEVGLGGVDIYGLLCSPLVIPAIQMFQGENDELVESAANLGAGIAEAIESAAATYEALEEQAAAHAKAIEDAL